MQTKQGPDELYCVGNARTVYLQNGWERYQDACKASLCALIVEADPFQNGDHATMPTWYVLNQLSYMGIHS